MPEVCNISARLPELAQKLPDKKAVMFPLGRNSDGSISYKSLTFQELNKETALYASAFQKIGIGPGTKTLLMVKPGLEFISLTFALFRAGAVPVLIDPGMGKDRLLHCIKEVQPEALVGIPLAHFARLLYGKFFKSVKINVTVGRRWLWGGWNLKQLKKRGLENFACQATQPNDLAAILFTTGSTGPAKGVEYEHLMFEKQCGLIQESYGIGEDDIDLPTFPLFALFSVGLGMTAVIPDMDPTCPAKVNPENIVQAIQQNSCTFSFGSPALWDRVTDYCIKNNVSLPSLKNVLLAGAPVPTIIHERFETILGQGALTHTPYGATESLPVTSFTGKEVLAETAELTRQGKGTCVGKAVPGIELEIIKISDEAIADWSEDLILPDGEIGEIVVKGQTVTKRYHNLPTATALAKIKDGNSIRHRIGDLGYKDKKSRLWFCGRKNHRVETKNGTLYSLCCEAIYNQHEQVKRAALVGKGKAPEQEPIIIIEPFKMPGTEKEKIELLAELKTLGQANELTKEIERLYLHPGFPVDIRHNAKIRREELREWIMNNGKWKMEKIVGAPLVVALLVLLFKGGGLA